LRTLLPTQKRTHTTVLLSLVLALSSPVLLLPLPARAQQQAQQVASASAATVRPAVVAKKPITHDVYDQWRSIQGAVLSRGGEWVAYTLSSQESDPELIVRNLKTGAEKKYACGRNATITPDDRFLLFTVVPSKAEVEKAKGKPVTQQPKNALGIVDLATGKQETIERVRRFDIASEGARYVAYIQDPAPAAPPSARPAARSGEAGNDDFVQAPGGGRRGQGQGRPGGAAAGAPPGGGGPTGAAAAPPADLIVRDLATGQAILTVSAPDTFVWNKEGSRLLYATSPRDAEKKAVVVRDMAKGTDTTLVSGKGTYRSFTFDDRGEQVAFLADRAVKEEAKKENEGAAAAPAAENKPDEEDRQQRRPLPGRPGAAGQAPGAAAATPPGPSATYAVWHWKVGDEAAREVVTAKTGGMPAGFVVSDNAGSLRFSKDGSRLYCGYKPAPKPPRAKDAPEPIKVDIWSSNDDVIQPMQKARAAQEGRRDYTAVWHVRERRFVPLATPEMPEVNPGSEAKRFALGTDDRPYRRLMSWDTSYRDIYVVEIASGKRRLVREKHSGSALLSPDEKYLLYWDTETQHWMTLSLDGGQGARPVDLTGAIKEVSFANETWDTPGPPSPYGIAGWTENDGSVLLYDRYDIWQVSPENKFAPRRLTDGRAREYVYRYERLDSEERLVPTDKPLLLSLLNDRTKASGYARLAPLGKVGGASASATSATPTTLVLLDKRFGSFRKAKNADTVLFTLSRFDEYPDLWTASLDDLQKRTRLSDANPQQKQYNWGTAELVEYKNADGVRLKAVLHKPEDFDPTKKYPLMVYIYETLSDGLHNYSSPGPGTNINITRYVSNGYIVLRPDIVYTTGYPGESALKCVLPAIQEIVDQGYIDEKRIGIQGHSWGAYQIAYMITRTNRFAAVEAGAAVCNMISAYGGIRWESGMSRQFQYERTQSRIGGTPWNKTREYLENSPIFWADKVTTPYLTIHNDEDGAVPWEQGIEFVTALRRLGREAYLFNYNGEGHGLSNRENQKHWTVHMDEFFDHYLLGKPRPEWMDKGVPYLERGTRDLTAFYGKKKSTETAATSSGEAKGAGEEAGGEREP